MLQPHRTRSFRRKKVKLPGGRITIHYVKRKPKQAHEAITKKPLHGIPRLIPVKFRKLSKSQRTVSRPYGGVLSHSSLKEKIIASFPIVNHPLEVGRLIVKTAGRDAGKLGVIVEKINDHMVLIDGQVRRRKCNVAHLETLDQKIDIKPKTSTSEIQKELQLLKINTKETKPKEKKQRPKKQKKEIKTEEKIVKKKEKKEAKKTKKNEK